MASFLRRVVPPRVANSGSQQRDHHANERTFLSWTRAGLGFAAMALALDRLEAVDHLMHKHLGLGPRNSQTPDALAKRDNFAMLKESVTASRVCQGLGAWSLGYGFFRYWSMRRYLLVGQFVPAFWGPVFMTVGSFGALVTLGSQVKLAAPVEE